MYNKPYTRIEKPRIRSGNIVKNGVTFLGRVIKTVGNVKTDMVLEQRRLVNGKVVYALMEYTTILNELNPKDPETKELHVWTYEDFAQLIDMSGRVLDTIEHGDRRNLPIIITMDAKGSQDIDDDYK
jgi:hypothetical protein